MGEEIQSQPVQIEGVEEGMYLYCAVNGGAETGFDERGIEDSKVHIISHKDVAVVVHDCSAKPYETKDEEKAKEWVLAHQHVIDQATKRFGTVIPFTFDTIIKGNGVAVGKWLEKEYRKIKGILEKLKDRSEYGIQIFLDEDILRQVLEEKNKEIKKLKEDIETKPDGVAYMLRRKLERVVNNELSSESEKYFNVFYNEIIDHLDDVKVEDAKKDVSKRWKDKRMILNLACLVHKDGVKKLGDVLGEINKKREFSVRFTGPWAPFSFVGEDLNER